MIKKIVNSFKNIGPGPLIAAAIIGPGTVTLCTVSGAYFGLSLLWAVLFSVIAAIILQEMSVRVGMITQKSLTQVLREVLKHPVLKSLVFILILAAILVGNTAYEAGNISGGVLGMETITGEWRLTMGSLSINGISLILGGIAFVLLYIGNYKVLERVLVVLVLLMSLSFLTTAILTKPNIIDVMKGLFGFSIPEGSFITIIGLVGTTIVPYNLFLHSSLVKEKWTKKTDLKVATRDMVMAMIVSGVISLSIIISAAASPLKEVENATSLAQGLEPLFGVFAKYFLGIGLFAAGLTSAVTAPLAAAYVASGCFGWKDQLTSKKFRLIWILVLVLGVFISSLGIKLITVIQFAQVTNGIILPLIAIVLLWIMNKKSVFGKHKNSIIQNIFGVIIVIFTLFIGAKTIISVFNS